eukprot:TRINITY_DN75390_c0_g1_i1.p1 TRINITY_DN75390_c0_g1~~TRINITY_DN75390_c0_g1_i1.p1  ORF type:complete len:810 (-),score=164.14 TRINITY_DN75390_c0_g1_i1:31-2439(-)
MAPALAGVPNGHSEKPPIYFDYNGTTPIDREACEAMTTMMTTHWGNPSSSHYFGVQAKKAMEAARRQTAELVGAQPGEITFMSNGTETINHALKGLAEIGEKERKTHFITQASEHVAVLEVCKALEKRGCSVTYLPVDSEGLVSVESVDAAITPSTVCISIMHSNNETGALQPVKEISALAKKASHRIFVHCDTSQSLGKLPVNVDDLGVDLLTIAGHKLYAPKGVGALYRRCTVPDLPHLIHGAGQESGRRASTENVIHIVGLGKACEVAKRDLEKNEKHMRAMRDRLYNKLLERMGSRAHLMRVNGPKGRTLPNTLSVSFFKVEANTLLSEVSGEVAASAGAACHSDEVHMSHVLEAMGVSKEWAMGTCRFSVGRDTTSAEIDKAAGVIAAAVLRLMPRDAGEGNDVAEEEVEGEEVDPSTVKLTRFTHGMGCACKLRPQVLERVLEQLRAAAPPMIDPNVLAGLGRSNEDACVYKVSDELAVVGTLDFFTPIVDDPEVFGGIAAANALSDVYAMGAKPIFALNIVGFPSNRLPTSVLAKILKGGQEKCTEAGIAVLGGHTVEDLEPKYGLAVIGLVHPHKVWRNNSLQAGDRLILTKPIGTGILGTAQKKGLLNPDAREKLQTTLLQLNRRAAEIAQESSQVHAATDVTGFGLLGHLKEMLTSSSEDALEPTPKKARTAENTQPSLPRLGALLRTSAVPLLPQAQELAVDDQCVPGGSVNNLKLVESAGSVRFAQGVSRELRMLLADAQTSGGLLLSVRGEDSKKLVTALRDAGMDTAAEIGEIRELQSAADVSIQVDE